MLTFKTSMSLTAPSDDDEEELSSYLFKYLLFWEEEEERQRCETFRNGKKIAHATLTVFLLSVKIVPSKSVSAADK